MVNRCRWCYGGILKGIFLFAFILFAGCGKNGETQQINDSRDADLPLEEWLGTYSFVESAPETESPGMFMSYTILIYKEGDSVCAEVSIDGQTTMAHAKAKIYGSDSWISLVFDEYYPDHTVGGFMNDGHSVLISFRKEGADILTYWGTIVPMLYENEASGEMYFKKET